MKNIILTLSLLFMPVYQSVHTQSMDSEEITISELYEHVAVLASDSLQGRKPGTMGGRMAAQYIADFLEEEELLLMNQQGFQYFDVVTSVKPGENNHFSFGQFNGESGKDFTPLSFSQNGTHTASVVFVGYGFDFTTDSLSWNDYSELDVSGKWAMILQGDPESQKSNSMFIPFSPLRKKVLVAKDRGAAGVLFVSGEDFDKNDDLIDLYYTRSQTDAGILVLQIKRHLADKLLENRHQTIAQLEKQLNQSRQPHSVYIDEPVTGTAEIIKIKAKTQNVVALLTGSDPDLRKEYIVLGAHYDHLGLGGPGSGSRRPDTIAVHNGADDNASGVAAIMEIIEKLAANKGMLKRSILFIAFGAEEMGTIGSRYFTDNPWVDLKQIRTMVNLDMVGRLDPVTKAISIGGTGTGRGLSDIVKNHIKEHGLQAKFSPEGYGPSDHASFYVEDIPVISLMTNIHDDYHTPEDDLDKINFDGLQLISELVYSLITELANRPDALVFQEAGPKTRPDLRRRFRVTLGIMPDIAATDIKGVRANAIIPGRPAALGGMEKGDIIVAMEGQPINDIYEYMHRLSDFKSGQRISVEVIRNEEKVILIVEL